MFTKSAVAALLLVSTARAQQPVWAQCGGEEWTGGTTCVSGTVCTDFNPFYSQCIPATTTLQTSVVSTPTPPPSPPTTPSSAKFLISFGDSYSQTGFVITDTKASPANPLGNPPFPGFTTDNGANWIGYLVETYNTSTLLSYNWAFGGATVDATLVAPFEPTVESLIDQTTLFSQNMVPAPSFAPWTSADTLFAIWMGVNDVGNSYFESNDTTILQDVLEEYFAQVQIMYNAGGRNFLFLTVPPIDKTPLMLANPPADETLLANAIAQFNSMLNTSAAAFKSSHPGSVVTIYDTQVPFNTALADPTAFGAADATCFNADGVSCLWWNNYHPGQAIQNLVAKGIATTLKGSFF